MEIRDIQGIRRIDRNTALREAFARATILKPEGPAGFVEKQEAARQRILQDLKKIVVISCSDSRLLSGKNAMAMYLSQLVMESEQTLVDLGMETYEREEFKDRNFNQNTLQTFYAKLGVPENARNLFLEMRLNAGAIADFPGTISDDAAMVYVIGHGSGACPCGASEVEEHLESIGKKAAAIGIDLGTFLGGIGKISNIIGDPAIHLIKQYGAITRAKERMAKVVCANSNFETGELEIYYSDLEHLEVRDRINIEEQKLGPELLAGQKPAVLAIMSRMDATACKVPGRMFGVSAQFENREAGAELALSQRTRISIVYGLAELGIQRVQVLLGEGVPEGEKAALEKVGEEIGRLSGVTVNVYGPEKT
ncbi:Uncharacterised protein [Candidatus Gugararchaeum adminiculabundum]|nr:Uncharacterised protein [Candidatus Gugararchaeum adminiculabundum]